MKEKTYQITEEQLKAVVWEAKNRCAYKVAIIGNSGSSGECIEVCFTSRLGGKTTNTSVRIFGQMDTMELSPQDWPHIKKWLAEK